MEIVRELIPPLGRQIIYATYAVAGLTVGAIEAAGGLPWTPQALAVLAYLAVPLSVLAGVNVPTNPDHMDGMGEGGAYTPRYAKD